jgi:hypothetical protein
MSIVSLAIDAVTIDSLLQPRVGGIDPKHVEEIQDAFDLCPPIKVVQQGDKYVLLDGFHRYAAAQNLGLETIPVEIVQPNDEDLFGIAFALNAAHGRPLTLSDRRNYASRILRAEPSLSDREVGRRVGLMQPTIAKVRQELERSADIPVLTERIGRDGQTYAVAPKKAGGGTPLIEVLGSAVTPGERADQRKLVRYFTELATMLAQQDDLPGFESIDDAVQACTAVLGEEKAAELAETLGWSSRNVLQIAQGLGFTEEAEA